MLKLAQLKLPRTLWWMIASYIFVFGLIVVWKYYNFAYSALDLAIFNQVFYNSLHGNFFASSIHPPSYLGDHIAPIILLLLPIYALGQQPLTLLLLQTIVMALSAWPLYLIARNVLGQRGGLLLAAIWLLNPFVHNITLFEFHLIPLATLLILWAFYFYQQQKFRPFLLFGFLALLVREDVALVVGLLGILALIDRRQWRWILTPLIAAGAYFVGVLTISNLIAPADQYKFFVYYAWLGSDWREFIVNFIFQPWRVIAHLLTLNNLVFILGLLLPFTFLPLLKPKYLLLGAGVVAQLLLGISGGSGTLLFLHYPALLLPALFISFIYALDLIKKQPAHRRWAIVSLLQKNRKLVFLIIGVTVLYTSLTLGPLPSVATIWTERGAVWPQTETKRPLLKAIPADAAMATTYQLLPGFSSRSQVSSFNYLFLGKQQFLQNDYSLPPETQYIVLDFADLTTYELQYGNNPFYQTHYQTRLANWPTILNNFGLETMLGTVAVYHRGGDNQIDLLNFPESLPNEATLLNNSGTGPVRLVGVEQISNVGYQLFWQADTVPPSRYQIKFTLIKDNTIVTEQLYPFAYGLLASTAWQPAQLIQTNYWITFSKKIPPGQYQLEAAVIDVQSGGIEVDGLRSTTNIIDQFALVSPPVVVGTLTVE